MPTLYIETSIVSYLQSRPSGQVVAAARQLLTHTWWANERHQYELVTSQYVLDEAADGDAAVARRRLDSLNGIPILPLHQAILEIAEEILRRAILPRSASVDALHLAMVAHHQVDYLLTWNCTHIANARILPKVFDVLDHAGLTRPIICTPEELLTDDTEIV
jgi:predicted nucleic acid-binding protein